MPDLCKTINIDHLSKSISGIFFLFDFLFLFFFAVFLFGELLPALAGNKEPSILSMIFCIFVLIFIKKYNAEYHNILLLANMAAIFLIWLFWVSIIIEDITDKMLFSMIYFSLFFLTLKNTVELITKKKAPLNITTWEVFSRYKKLAMNNNFIVDFNIRKLPLTKYYGILTFFTLTLSAALFSVELTTAIILGLLLSILPAIFLVRFLQKKVRASAAQVTSLDHRKPILFLRSFSQDSLAVLPSRSLYLPFAQPFTLEEIINNQFSKIGPVITIAEPSKKTHPLGGARLHCDSKNWELSVEDKMKESQYIVIQAGSSEGLIIEILMSIRLNLIPKTIIVFPFLESDLHKEYFEVVQTCFTNTAWEESLFNCSNHNALTISFSLKGGVTYVTASKPQQIQYELALLHAIYQTSKNQLLDA